MPYIGIVPNKGDQMINIQLTEEQFNLLQAAVAGSRADWCNKAVNALIEGHEDEPTFSRIYAKMVALDEHILLSKDDTKLAA